MRKKKRNFTIEKFAGETDVLLLLSGRVDAAASAVLGPQCAALFEADFRLTLDLGNVDSADRVGLQLLISLWELGATVTNVPADIAKKIETTSHKLRWPLWH